jgi:hypothetical protein
VAEISATQLGIFGSPTFAVGREIFWGDDRLTTPWPGAGNPRPERVTRQFALARPGGPSGGAVLAKLGRVAWRW